MTVRIWTALEEVALCSDMVQSSRHGAGLVYRGKLLVTGNNKYKSHPLMQEFNPDNLEKIYLHAEIDCIIRGINLFGVEWLKECSLYVLRIRKDGKIGNSKPCKGCMRAIEAFDIGEVKWT